MYKDGDYLCFDTPTGQIRFHEDLKKYYQLLTNFRAEAESLSKIIDSASGPSSALESVSTTMLATVYKGNIIKNLIMDCQSYTKYRPNETTGGIFVSWRRKEELPTGA